MYQDTVHSQAVAGTGVARVRSASVCAMPTNGSWHLAIDSLRDPRPEARPRRQPVTSL